MEIAEPERPGGEAETATAVPMPEVEAAFEEIEVDAPLVGIIMGSANDKQKMQPAGGALHDAGIRYEVRVMSAHRDPEKVREYCQAARMRGLKVIIAGAGMSAALPGVAAAHTDLPVVGVPLTGKSLGGLDARRLPGRRWFLGGDGQRGQRGSDHQTQQARCARGPRGH